MNEAEWSLSGDGIFVGKKVLTVDEKFFQLALGMRILLLVLGEPNYSIDRDQLLVMITVAMR